MDADSVNTLLTTLRNQLRDLPEVNTTAKLRALVGRIGNAMSRPGDLDNLIVAATQLEEAANRALDADPWVRLHRSASKLLSALNEQPT